MTDGNDPYLDDPFGDLLQRHKQKVQEQSSEETIRLQISVEEARELSIDVDFEDDRALQAPDAPDETEERDPKTSSSRVGRNPRAASASAIRKTVRFSEAEAALLMALARERSISEVVREALLRATSASLDAGEMDEDEEHARRVRDLLDRIEAELDGE